MESGHKPYAQLPGGADTELVPSGATAMQVPPGAITVQMPPGATTMQMPPGAVPPGATTMQMPPGAAVMPLPPGATAVPLDTPLPRDYLAWSLSNLLYFNCCCLGLMAVIFSIKSRDRRMLGDLSGALSYGATAKALNIAAIVLILVVVVIITAVLSSVLTTRY